MRLETTFVVSMQPVRQSRTAKQRKENTKAWKRDEDKVNRQNFIPPDIFWIQSSIYASPHKAVFSS